MQIKATVHYQIYLLQCCKNCTHAPWNG